MNVLKNNLAKNDIFVISGYGSFIFIYARQHTGLLWHTVVRPSVHASYDNISHLFPLLLIGHVLTYIVLIKEGGSERCDFMVYTINWLKKCSILITVLTLSNWPSIVTKEGGGGAYHGTVVYFVIFRCCFFPWYKGSLRDNSFNRNFLYMRLS